MGHLIACRQDNPPNKHTIVAYGPVSHIKCRPQVLR